MSRRHRIWYLVALGVAAVGGAAFLLATQQPRPPVPLIWVVRGTALVGYWAVFLAIVSSALPAESARLFGRSFRALHYGLAVTGLVLITVHPVAVGLVVRRADVFVPNVETPIGFLQEGGRPAWYLFVITSALALLGRRLGRTWRLLHLLTYVAFWLATVHALLIGRTHSNPVLRGVTIAMACVAAGVMLVRRMRHRRGR